MLRECGGFGQMEQQNYYTKILLLMWRSKLNNSDPFEMILKDNVEF